jgi:hypothetical protein
VEGEENKGRFGKVGGGGGEEDRERFEKAWGIMTMNRRGEEREEGIGKREEGRDSLTTSS